MNGHAPVKDVFDLKDHYHAPESRVQRPKMVNLRQDRAQLVSEIYDQLKTDSCTANAIAAAFWYKEKASKREPTWGTAGPSRLFIYWLARGAYHEPDLRIYGATDRGSSVREAMKGIAKCGVCSEEDWPFDMNFINERPSKAAIENALPHANNKFYRLDSQRPDNNKGMLSTEEKDKIGAAVLDNLRQCLAEQYPVVFALWYYLPAEESYDKSQTPFLLKDVWALVDRPFPRHTFQEDLPVELRIKNKAGRFVTPGHTVLAIGYDDEKQAVLIQNSRGAKWGGNGTFWMPYSWITDCGATNDFWTVRPTTTQPESSSYICENVHQEILGTSYCPGACTLDVEKMVYH